VSSPHPGPPLLLELESRLGLNKNGSQSRHRPAAAAVKGGGHAVVHRCLALKLGGGLANELQYEMGPNSVMHESRRFAHYNF